MSAWLEEQYPRARSLSELYRPDVPRRQIYAEMVEAILAPLRENRRVCAAFYGHPGVFVTPSHEAIRRARDEGYPARMLPAVSAESCLIADLGVDPGEAGWQSYEATKLLLGGHTLDPTAAVVLWQVDAIGKLTWNLEPEPQGLRVLGERLLEQYPPEHEVVFYRASLYPVADPVVERVRLEGLAELESAPGPTLYIPPLPARPVDAEMARRLGIRPA